jgi:hypothetical protein
VVVGIEVAVVGWDINRESQNGLVGCAVRARLRSRFERSGLISAVFGSCYFPACPDGENGWFAPQISK